MSAETAAEVLDEAVDVIEDAVNLAERKASWLVRNPKALIGAALLGGAVIGSVATYLVASKKLQTKYQALADASVEDVKAHYSAIHKSDVSLAELASAYPDEEKAADISQVADLLEEQGYVPYDKVESVVEAPATPMRVVEQAEVLVEESVHISEVVRNIFESDDPETYFDFEEELQRRTDKPDVPFVITKDEFDGNETDYAQATLTYFDGDDVLADDKDKAVDDLDGVVGYENILRFGHGSGDPRVVYIRNTKLELDLEVIQSDGKFSKEVLGFDDELTHSDRRPQRRFRASDE